MSDKMRPIPFSNLLRWIFSEWSSNDSIFGIPEIKFFRKKNQNFYNFNGHKLETPFGPAAGPHTQLAHNIVATYLVGGRFIELKTVQILDALEIEKPCIDVADEGYNVEWSQELSIEQSFDEYLKAFLIVQFFRKFSNLSPHHFSPTIFNMSVGYDLKGIQSEKVDKFINKMKNAKESNLYIKYIEEFYEFYKRTNFLKEIDEKEFNKFLEEPNEFISNSVTLSTMHGCPAHEIEEIATYLIEEKKLDTFVKLNPTLLGYERVREILDKLGYNYISLKKESFEHDLKFDDAIPMIKRLLELAKKRGQKFGIKLSNTLGVVNTKKVLPGDEMYMSGRSLFPLTINLAYEITKEIGEDLHISYSGGANILNAIRIVDAGIYPVTFATELLKPGGYLRLSQIANDFEEKFGKSIDEQKINLEKLKLLCEEALEHHYYKKDFKEFEQIKINNSLPVFDCYVAPCEVTCPIHQDVSEYVYLTSQGRFEEAFEVIIEKNPLPHITGYICDHQCMTKCNRWDYDYPVAIRDLKKLATEKAFENYLDKFKSTLKSNLNNNKVAVIGAGPSGLSASYFLARAGFDVTIFEKTDKAGGTVRHIIPQFRIPQEVIDKDINFIQHFGVNVVYNSERDLNIDDLKTHGFKYIFIGIGAEIPNELKLKSQSKILDALDFLKRFNKNEKFKLGKTVIVVGGGNSAMDAARAAKRIDEVENVIIVYRRTIEYMPADKEELNAAIKDGVKIFELLQPIEFDGRILKCQRMQLGELDDDGRRKSIPIENEFVEIQADTIITAIGERTDYDFLTKNKIELDEKNNIIINPDTNETTVENVYVGGDTLRGPATVVEAIADGKKVAEAIIKKENLQINFEIKNDYKDEMIEKVYETRGNVEFNFSTNFEELATRCLLCDVICNKCVEVCPNRANIPIEIKNSEFKDRYQIVHIDALCNECGNCETFCPYNGRPYKDKFTIFSNEEEFYRSQSTGFLLSSNQIMKIRFLDRSVKDISYQNTEELMKKINDLTKNGNGHSKIYSIVEEILSSYSYLIF